MMETTLTGTTDSDLIEELQRVAQRFLGKQVKVVIQEVNGDERPRRRKE